MAAAHGHRRGEGHLRRAGGDGGVCQRPGPQPQSVSVSGAGSGEGENHRLVVRPGSQRGADARPAGRTELNGRRTFPAARAGRRGELVEDPPATNWAEPRRYELVSQKVSPDPKETIHSCKKFSGSLPGNALIAR